MADYVAKSGSKLKIHGPEPFSIVPYASCVGRVKDWSTDRWKSMWNERKDCLRMKESVGWTSSRLTIRLLNLIPICTGGGQIYPPLSYFNIAAKLKKSFALMHPDFELNLITNIFRNFGVSWITESDVIFAFVRGT